MANTKVPVELFDAGAGFTIGSGAAEDTKIVFDGNAQDYYVGLDDSADKLIIGVGSAVGTTAALSVDSSQNLEKVILPIRGYGLWGTLFGYIAIVPPFIDLPT